MNELNFLSNFIYRHPTNPVGSSDITDEMIYLASTSLMNQVQKGEDSDRVKTALKKYTQRSSTRPTPFGLFAGCNVGKWADAESKITTHERYRYTRLDMSVVCNIAEKLSEHPTIKKKLKYNTNSSLYLNVQKYTYLEYKINNNIKDYQSVSIDYQPYISEVIEKTNLGASYGELVNVLKKYSHSAKAATIFLDQLIQSQVIVSQLYPNVTGIEFYTVILTTIQGIASNTKNREIQRINKILTNVNNMLSKLDNKFINPVAEYVIIYLELKKILPDLKEQDLFQVDMYYRTNQANLDIKIQNNLKKAVNFLFKISHQKTNENLNLFKSNFLSRYEDEEVPLAVALDPTYGIGYPHNNLNGINPLVDNIDPNVALSTQTVINLNAQDIHLFHKVNATIQGGQKTLILSDEDIVAPIENTNLKLPPTIPVLFTVLSTQPGNHEIHLIGCFSNSASNLVARFAGQNSEIYTHFNEIIKHEKEFYPEKIDVELVHLPQSRAGNVLLRPNSYTYEFPYLANSLAPLNKVINLNDILISIKNNKIILRSKTLGKEITPRITSAHDYNYSGALPMYEFLGDLQSQHYDRNGARFKWDRLNKILNFLPRVEYNNIILCPAQWNIFNNKTETQLILKNYTEEKFIKWVKQLQLPNQFLFCEGDNELFVDLTNDLSMKAFISIASKSDQGVLREFLPNGKAPLITDKKQEWYTNEIIATLVNKPILNDAKDTLRVLSNDYIQRKFTPGSEWLYYKIYLNPALSDSRVLTELYSITEKLKTEERIKKWHFLRYMDPNEHLRVRFNLTNPQHLSHIQWIMHHTFSPLVDTKVIDRIQIDTYNRELERYGFSNIENTELYFDVDSSIAVELINELEEGTDGDLIKLQFASISCLALLKNFGFKTEEIIEFISNARIGFVSEFGGIKKLKPFLDEKFRTLRHSFEHIISLNETKELLPEVPLTIQLLQAQELNQISLYNSIQKKKLLSENDYPPYLWSLIHMQVNRLFRSKQRIYELLMYDLLHKTLVSLKARKII